MPELPPGSVCIHSTCRTKFSYWRSVRMTPVGCPEHTSMPFSTLHVSGAVLTLTHPARSLPLNRSRNSGTPAPRIAAAAKRRHTGRIAIGLRFMNFRPRADSISPADGLRSFFLPVLHPPRLVSSRPCITPALYHGYGIRRETCRSNHLRLPGTRAGSARQGLPPGVLLLARVKAHMRESLDRLPNCSCLETVHREHQTRGRQDAAAGHHPPRSPL